MFMNRTKIFIKSLVIGSILFLLLTFPCWAGVPITFVWEANSESDLAGYRLYQSNTSGQYIFGKGHSVATILAGTETVTLNNVPDGKWFWVLTAFDNAGNESKPSNEVDYSVDTVAPSSPILRVVIIVETP